jgi:hypothetical protein
MRTNDNMLLLAQLQSETQRACAVASCETADTPGALLLVVPLTNYHRVLGIVRHTVSVNALKRSTAGTLFA